MDMARGRLRLLLMLSLVIEAMDTAATADLMEAMEVMAGPMGGMEAMDMARGRLRLLLMLSLVIEAMDTAATADLMEVMADPMEDRSYGYSSYGRSYGGYGGYGRSYGGYGGYGYGK